MFDVRFATSDLEQEDAFSVRRKVFVEEQGVPLDLELDHLDKTAAHFVVYSSESPIGAGRIQGNQRRNRESRTSLCFG